MAETDVIENGVGEEDYEALRVRPEAQSHWGSETPMLNSNVL